MYEYYDYDTRDVLLDAMKKQKKERRKMESESETGMLIKWMGRGNK